MNIDILEDKAKRVRRQVLEMIVSAGKGHIGGSFSCIDILVALYWGGILHFDVTNPNWDERDRFILSKGHACASLYAILADIGFFPISELESFNREGSRLEGHPNRSIPGIEADTGSLGHGLGIGAGLALSAQLDNKDWKTVILLSDGELQCGSTWEAVMFAAQHNLNNLFAIVDNNKLCSTDFANGLEPLIDKWLAFNWTVKLCDGHSIRDLLQAFSVIHDHTATPMVIIADTIKGKGVSFMEGKIEWHHKVPKGKELEIAREELR